MKITIIIGEVIPRKNAERDKSNAAMRFMWIPGVSPVSVPKRIPREIARKSSSIIYGELIEGINFYL